MIRFDFQNRLVVLTGGAGGIGLECAKIFATGGARIHLIDSRQDALETAFGALGSPKGQVTTHCSLLATPAECATALDAAGDTIFALVHLAGLFEPDPLDPASRDVWDRAIAVNLTTAYDMAVAFRPRAVRDSTNRLIFLNSVAGGRGSPDYTAYSCAKAGLFGMVRALARKFAPDVLVNAIAPGVIETPMTREMIKQRGPRGLDEIALKRFGHPREVASVIAFLCSDGATYITGQTIQVDGGIVLR